MDFLNRDNYINDNHFNFCNSNNDLLIDYNKLININHKCFIEKSKNDVNCNKISKKYKNEKIQFLHDNPKQISFLNNDISYTNYNKKEGTIDSIIRYNKTIEYNNYNKKYNNNIYINEKGSRNIINIQTFIDNNDRFLATLTKDEIKTLQYYTYKGDVFLNFYIRTSKFDIDYNTKNAQISDKHMFFSVDLNDYLFKTQMLKFFKDNDDIINKITNKTLSNYDLMEDDYKLILDTYLKDMNIIFKKAPKISKDLYLYRGIETNYIYDNIVKDGQPYNNKYLLSSSLFVNIAYKYTKKSNRIICRFKINKGTPVIFVDGISLAAGDMEVIIPNDTILTLSEEDIKIMLYNKDDNFTKDVICPREYLDTDIINVIDFNIILK